MTSPLDEIAAELDGRIERLVLFARCGERIAGAMTQTKNTLDALSSVLDLDPALAPELLAAAEGLTAAHSALMRACQFTSARLDVQSPPVTPA